MIKRSFVLSKLRDLDKEKIKINKFNQTKLNNT